MYWIDKLVIVSTINSANDTITENEAREIIYSHGGDPEWVVNPPPWVEWINEYIRAFHKEVNGDE